jgi:outer membrane protein assembly factor BamD (BamD/ComL family)
MRKMDASKGLSMKTHIKCLGCLMLVLFVVACSGQSAEELLDTARLEERQNNPAHAIELYQQIVTRYPDSEPAKIARERLQALQPKP